MKLTTSKRFEFSASVRVYRPDWSDKENEPHYGPGTRSVYGFGNNYTVYFIFQGPIDKKTGMVINLTSAKERIQTLLQERYDHKFLNADTHPFDKIPPTPENMAVHLLREAQPLFADHTAKPVACHLEVNPEYSANAYTDGTVESEVWVHFSAARRTWSPHLSQKENDELFGIAGSPMGHGHNYRLRGTFTGLFDESTGHVIPFDNRRQCIAEIQSLLDHKNLNEEVPLFHGHPMTTECLTRFVFNQMKQMGPVSRVKLHETDDFFVEYEGNGRFRVGYKRSFNAAHRLHSKYFSDEENMKSFGKCNNPNGHGHRYQVEASVSGNLDERSGTLCNLISLQKGLATALSPWDYKHLDIETDEFKNVTSTGENIILLLWPKCQHLLPGNLARLRLWETPNNRFTIRE